jgi:hypothetical protein
LIQEGEIWKTGDAPIIFEMTKKKMDVMVVTKTENGGTKIIFEGELETSEQCDFDDPLIAEDNSPLSGTTGDAYTFNVSIIDDNKVFVYAHWSHGDKQGNMTLQRIGTTSNYSGTIITDHNLSDLTYYVYVKDYWDNTNKTIDKSVEILDNDPPKISLNTIIHCEDSYNLSAEITDNIQILDHILNLTYPNGTITELDLNKSNNTYYYEITLTQSGEYFYFINSSDGVNQAYSEIDYFTISESGTNLRPRQETPTVYSSLNSNTAGEDLICRNGSSSDPENDFVTSIYTWYKNDDSFAELYYSFNTNCSSETRDYTDSENNGSITGAKWITAGIVGGAYQFDGEGDLISCTLPSVLTDLSQNDVSITAWVNSSDISEHNNCIIEGYDDSANYVQLFQHNSRIYAGVCVDNQKYILKSDPLQSNLWYHTGLLWDSSENQIRLYINGSECLSFGDESYLISGGSHSLSIGQKTDGDADRNGLIDEVYLYNHLVSEDHVYQQYLCTRNGSSSVSVIVSEETAVGDNWYCTVTPNDSYQDGNEEIGLEINIE